MKEMGYKDGCFVSFFHPSVKNLTVEDVIPMNRNTVYVQIFEARKFRGCHKSSIFTILFSRITKYPTL